MKRFLLGLLIFFFPFFASAAGFAKQSLFLSRASVTEGETVLIHAVVSNDATTKFSGTLVFAEADSPIGSVPVALSPGESSVISVSWKPAAGSHTVTATLKNTAGAVESQSATFVITPKPVSVSKSSGQAAAVESSQNIQNSIASYSPQAAGAAAPLFTLVDSGRAAAADVLGAQITNIKQALGPSAGQPSGVLSAEQTKNASANPVGALVFILQTLYLYLLTILLFIVNSAAVFYPVLAIAFLYAVWKIFRRFRRPAYY